MSKNYSASTLQKALDQTVNQGDPKKRKRAQVFGYDFKQGLLKGKGNGCGSPTPVVGTAGKAPCGSKVGGVEHLCHHCKGAGVAESLLEDDTDPEEFMVDQVDVFPLPGATDPALGGTAKGRPDAEPHHTARHARGRELGDGAGRGQHQQGEEGPAGRLPQGFLRG